MLFYLPRELFKYKIIRYRILYFSIFFHIFILFLTFFLNTIKKNKGAIILNARKMSAQVSFSCLKRQVLFNNSKGSFKNLENLELDSIIATTSELKELKKQTLNDESQKKIKDISTKTENLIEYKKPIIKPVESKKIKANEINKKVFENYLNNNPKVNNNPIKEISKNSNDVKDKKSDCTIRVDQKKKDDNKLLQTKEVFDKNLEIKKVVEIKESNIETIIEKKSLEKKDFPKNKKDDYQINETEKIKYNKVSNDISKDFFEIDQSDVRISQAILKHLRIPPGFKYNGTFRISFEIGFNGKPRNINKITNEPLILYTAYKQAILKASFVPQDWGRKVEFVIKDY